MSNKINDTWNEHQQEIKDELKSFKDLAIEQRNSCFYCGGQKVDIFYRSRKCPFCT